MQAVGQGVNPRCKQQKNSTEECSREASVNRYAQNKVHTNKRQSHQPKHKTTILLALNTSVAHWQSTAMRSTTASRFLTQNTTT